MGNTFEVKYWDLNRGFDVYFHGSNSLIKCIIAVLQLKRMGKRCITVEYRQAMREGK